MKGEPGAPRCGFSATVLELLAAAGVRVGGAAPAAPPPPAGTRFAFFDILSDADVREGLKRVYNWPTFPQLYIKGALVGGLDVLREMHADGELRAALEAAGVAEGDGGAGGGHSHGGAPCDGQHGH